MGHFQGKHPLYPQIVFSYSTPEIFVSSKIGQHAADKIVWIIQSQENSVLTFQLPIYTIYGMLGLLPPWPWLPRKIKPLVFA